MRLLEEDESEISVSPAEKEIKMRDLPDFIQRSRGRLSSAEIGTLLHRCLQHIDLAACRNIVDTAGSGAREGVRSILEDTVRGMRERGFLLPEEAPFIDCDLLVPFFFSEVGRRLLSAESVRRELPFTMLKPASELGLDGEGWISVQGMIDCCFLEDGGYILLDFKSDDVSGDTLRQRAESYRTQLDLYAEALQKITGRPVIQKILYFLRENQTVYFG